MATKPRGFSDPPYIEFKRTVYDSSLTAPAALGSKKKYAEPYALISATELLSEDISYSGWIRKEGLRIRTWKNRYMILHHGCIYYFKGTYSTVPKGKFALNGYRCEVAPERDKADMYSYNFKLVSENENERTYFFSCPSNSEMEGWIKEINDDIRTYCSEQDDDVYDYVDASNFSEKKYPTVAKAIPPRPEPRRNYSSLPNSPEESRHLFPYIQSDYLGISTRFPNQPQSCPTRIPRKPVIPPKIPVRSTHANPPTTDQEDSDSDYIPEVYLDLKAPENEPIHSPDCPRSAFSLPPQRSQRGLPGVEKGAQNETAANPETEEIYLPVIADDDEQTQCEQNNKPPPLEKTKRAPPPVPKRLPKPKPVPPKFRVTQYTNKLNSAAEEREVGKARSLALRFMTAHPCCVRTIPYENSDQSQNKSISMCLYVHTGGQGIQNDLKKHAEKIFSDYQVEFVDLQRQPLCKNVKRLSSNEKKNDKELSDLAELIEENLNIFENRLNVTAVQPSYKITDNEESATPCVTVFMLGKGRIPLGENDFSYREKLSNYPFDVIEGYYRPSSSFESSASPLHGGVGIGVKKLPGVGTLGGFLKDDDGKCYLLSCEHVLHPEGVFGISDVIVQPAEHDFKKKINEDENKIKDKRGEITKMETKLACMQDDGEQNRYKGFIKTRSEDLEELERQLNYLKIRKPREVGKYLHGLQRNERPDNTDKYIFVDACIAELEKNEIIQMELEKDVEEGNSCPVYGFSYKNYTTGSENEEPLVPPTGEIVRWTEFCKESKKELRFIKCGRSTGVTVNGQIETHNFFLNRKISQAVTDYPFKEYCENCSPPPDNNIVETSSLEKQKCDKCSNQIEKGNTSVLWARNCLTLRQAPKSFAEEGDSGSIVFDNQGRAWSVLFGTFNTQDKLISLTAPLDVTIQALQKKLKKKLRLWQVFKT